MSLLVHVHNFGDIASRDDESIRTNEEPAERLRWTWTAYFRPDMDSTRLALRRGQVIVDHVAGIDKRAPDIFAPWDTTLMMDTHGLHCQRTRILPVLTQS